MQQFELLEMQSTPSQDFMIAPDYRRCCWYIIVGFAACFGLSIWVAQFFPNGRPAAASLLLILPAAMVVPLSWRLRLDQHGISRRRLFWWDSWPWSDFASGRVAKLHPYTLADPSRTWGRRKLRLEYMAEDDIREVMSAVNEHYQLPAPPDLREVISIKYGFRRSATFNRNGINLLIRDLSYVYMWNDVEQVHIRRMDALRRDFKSLTLILPNQEIELKLFMHQGGTSQTWRGATPEEINELLLRHVAPDRIEISIEGEPLATREQVEKDLLVANKNIRQFTICIAILFALLVALVVWRAIDKGIPQAVWMAACFAVFPGSVVVYVYLSLRKRVATLNRLLAMAVTTDD